MSSLYSEFKNPDAPIYQIEAWRADDSSYVTLVLTSEGVVRRAAWDLLQGSYRDKRLVMRQGARVMEKREPLG